MPNRFESESGVVVNDPTEAQLDLLLGQLDGTCNSFASLTTPNGSYIQVGGGPTEFTVEIRHTHPDGSFRHLKATRPHGVYDERRLNIGGTSVSVRSDQVLDLSQVRQLFRFFALNHKADPSFTWQDITTMFQDAT